MTASVWIGFDPRPAEVAGFAVTRSSLFNRMPRHWPVRGLVLSSLRVKGLYTRPIEWRQSAANHPIMWDVISDAPMSTEFAISRFLVPLLAKSGWALFMDGDMLVRGNVGQLFETLDKKYAVYCVKHKHVPTNKTKMDDQVQTQYARKNWSSFMIFNCDHLANKSLTIDMVNTLPGRDLHRLCWLDDEEIGELDPSWNWLVGHSDLNITPNVVHFTDGIPSMEGYAIGAYAVEWREELARWAA